MEENSRHNRNLGQAGSIYITYFTDPLCCWSWAFEPEWRRLQYEFEGVIGWKYCMGGLLPGWNNFNDPVNSVSRPLQMGPVWMHAGSVSGMQIDSSIWMRDPPASSYPACIAVKCAALQSAEYAEQYLRMLRETVMLNGANISKHEVLLETAAVLEEKSIYFDAKLFKKHLFGREGLESFKIDMQQVKNYNINRFPAFIFRSKGQHPVMITGYRPYSALVDAMLQLAPGINKVREAKSEEEYKSYWHSVTKREIDEAVKH